MAGAIDNGLTLTEDFLRHAVKHQTIKMIAGEIRTDPKTVRRYLRIYGIDWKSMGGRNSKEKLLIQIIDDIHVAADNLQLLYFKAERLKKEIEEERKGVLG